jgi:4-diphosphocytidyl-2-C-methyl-D-erythritol kinase
LLKEYSKYPFGVDIHLKKMIPISSGLGGGSSNAAVTLLTLCKLWDLQISSDNLAILAQQIGSDVGFFLNSPSCLAEQKGDTITPIKTMNPTNMVLIVPKIDLNEKTSSMYQSLTNKDYTDGKLSMKMAKLIEDGEPPDNYLMFNVFENNAEARFPEISKGKKAMIDAGASWVQLSGSGPSLYTFTKSSTESKLISKNLQIIGYNPIISKTLNTY